MKAQRPQPTADGSVHKQPLHPAIEQMRAPMQNILRSIAIAIRKSSYKLIIGDDASGRIPALVLSGVIGKLQKTHGGSRPATIFLPGLVDATSARKSCFSDALSHQIHDYDLSGVFPVAKCTMPSQLSFQKNVRDVLIVTDAVQYGRSLRPLTEALEEHSIGFEIATLQHLSSFPPNPYNAPIHSGKLKGEREIYKRYDLIGVKKAAPKYVARRYPYIDQDIINMIRENVQTLRSQLIDWAESNLSSFKKASH